jgi:hypothetical protein
VKTRIKILTLIALLFAGVAAFLQFRHAQPGASVPSEYSVRYHSGMTLADVARTHQKFFAPALGSVTVERQDQSVSARCRDTLSSVAVFLLHHTGERSQVLVDAALRFSPSAQQLTSVTPAADSLALHPDDAILIPTRLGVTVLTVQQ